MQELQEKKSLIIRNYYYYYIENISKIQYIQNILRAFQVLTIIRFHHYWMNTKREENIYQRREYLSDSYDNMNYNDANNNNFFYNTVINIFFQNK